MRRDRRFLRDVPFARNRYGSIVQTSHPGAHDERYRARVARLVAASEATWPAIPVYDYAPDEDEVWRFVSQLLLPMQDRYACRAYLEGRDALGLAGDRLPQMDEVSARLEERSGFMLAPVGGLLESAEFLTQLGDRVMRCTPYVRHPSYPFFTPEPDIVHELRGHAPMFMNPAFAQMSEAIGRAAQAAAGAGNDALVKTLALFYWYTVEYGLVREGSEVKVMGSGNTAGIQDLLRSVDPAVERRPFDLDEIRRLAIDYDEPQQVFYVVESFEQVAELAYELGKGA